MIDDTRSCVDDYRYAGMGERVQDGDEAGRVNVVVDEDVDESEDVDGVLSCIGLGLAIHGFWKNMFHAYCERLWS